MDVQYSQDLYSRLNSYLILYNRVIGHADRALEKGDFNSLNKYAQLESEYIKKINACTAAISGITSAANTAVNNSDTTIAIDRMKSISNKSLNASAVLCRRLRNELSETRKKLSNIKSQKLKTGNCSNSTKTENTYINMSV